MARKTVQIQGIKDMINQMLAKGFDSREARQAQITFVEAILHETGNYKGFRMLLQNEVPVGELPGVRYGENGILPYPERFDNTDPTRIQFF